MRGRWCHVMSCLAKLEGGMDYSRGPYVFFVRVLMYMQTQRALAASIRQGSRQLGEAPRWVSGGRERGTKQGGMPKKARDINMQCAFSHHIHIRNQISPQQSLSHKHPNQHHHSLRYFQTDSLLAFCRYLDAKRVMFCGRSVHCI